MTLIGSLFGCNKQHADRIKILSLEDFEKAINQNEVLLVDVRTLKEFKAGHIEKAINIDYFDKPAFKESFEKRSKYQKVYIYCRSGNRSGKAAKILADMGFKKIYELEGGYLGWRR